MKKRTETMIIVHLLTLILMAGVSAPKPVMAGSGDIQWLSYAEGRQRGETEQKKVFLVFQADWCRYCHQMEKETFSDSAVIAYVNQNFVPVSVNSDRETDIAAKYNVRGLPSTWFLSEKGDRIGNRPGYISTNEMLTILKYIGTDSYLKMSFKEFTKKKK